MEFQEATWTDLGYDGVVEQTIVETTEVVDNVIDEVIDLDAYETGVYMYRWPNGEFSVIKAENRNDALLQLSEWAEADPLALEPMNSCMIDFAPNDVGELELVVFGGETHNEVMEWCYPELIRVLARENQTLTPGGEYSATALAAIRRAGTGISRLQHPGT